MIVLDTNVVSEAMKAKPNSAVRASRQVAALLLPLATGYNSSKFFAGG